MRTVGRWLCALNLHKWRFKELADNAASRNPKLITYAVCEREGCELSKHWRPVNVDSIRRPWN